MPGRTGRMALIAIAMLVVLPAAQGRTLRAKQDSGRLAANPVAIAYYPTDDAMRAVDDGRAEFTVVGSESSVKWLRSD